MNSKEYQLKKIQKLDLFSMNMVASLLNKCGKEMARKYDLHHWDNHYLKSLVIAGLCMLKNDVYLIIDENGETVASFQTKIIKDKLHFEKLCTLPTREGKGIGSLCINFIEDIAIKNKCRLVTMEVFENSKHAIDFYLHRGYRIVGSSDTLKYKEFIMEKEV